MSQLRRLKTALLAASTWGTTVLAGTTTESPGPITPEYLLTELVQIATQEDLADAKRMGSLLKLDIVMIPEPPIEMKDGRMAASATAEVPKDPGYFATGGTYFYYRHTTSPMRGALMSLNFDSRKLCINYKDLLPAFSKHGRECPNFCVRGGKRLVHGGGRRLRRTTDAVGKSAPHVKRPPW